MSKVRDISNLSNVIRTDASGNVSFVSGSTTLATLNTSGQLSGSSPVLSSSYALNADLLDGLDSTQFTLTSSFAAQTASFTAFSSSVNTFTSSLNSFSASILTFTASQNILNGKYATTGSNTFTGIQTINSNLIVTGSITAQTLVVQTITSSVDFVTGSTRFGSSLSTSTHQFTGSVSITGSLDVITTGTEFQVNASGVKIGNVIGDTHTITGSVSISGSTAFNGNVRLNAASSGTNKLIFGLASTDYYWLEYNDATGNIGYSSKYSHIFYGGGAGTTTILTLANNGAATFASSVTATTGTFSGKISANTSNGIFSNFGGTSIGTTAGNYTGISLGYSENTTYTKTAIVQEQINDGATRGHLHFLVDTANDGNNAVLGDSKMMINGLTGNVGIGGEPDQPLTVYGANIALNESPGNINVYTTNGYGTNLGASIGLGGYYNATTGKIAFASIHGKKENATANNAQGYMAFVVRNNSTGATERMRITGDGNVGIGTITPGFILDVIGSGGDQSGAGQTLQVKSTNGTSGQGTGIRISSVGGSKETVGILSVENNSGTNGDMVFRLYNGGATMNEKMRITSAGALQVSKNTLSDSVQIFSNVSSGTGTTGQITLNQGSSWYVEPQSGGTYYIQYSHDSAGLGWRWTTYSGSYANRFFFYANGTAYNSSGTWGNSSDIKLKQNIIDANSQWDDIKALKFKKYKLKKDVQAELESTDGYVAPTHFGLIAQDVELTSPGLVEDVADGEGTTKMIKTSIMLMKSVKALQEAMQRIETLETENDTLKEILQRNNIQ